MVVLAVGAVCGPGDEPASGENQASPASSATVNRATPPSAAISPERRRSGRRDRRDAARCTLVFHSVPATGAKVPCVEADFVGAAVVGPVTGDAPVSVLLVFAWEGLRGSAPGSAPEPVGHLLGCGPVLGFLGQEASR
jgi:hypothetical protein